MSRHPRRTQRAQRAQLSLALMLIASLLAACQLRRPAGRTPIPFTPGVAPTPTAVATGAAPAPAPPVSPVASPPPAEIGWEPARTIGDQPLAVPGEIIVKLEPQPAMRALEAAPQADGVVATGLPNLDRLNQEFEVTAFEPLVQPVAEAAGEEIRSFAQREPALLGLYVVTFDPRHEPGAVAAAYEAEANVVYAEPNFYAYASERPAAPPRFVPNDPYYMYQWHMPLIQAPEAWDRSTGRDVLVAVLDTGAAYEDYEIYRRAPDLGQTRFVQGYDFINNDTHANDDEGHGTHVAGTLAQSTDNGAGVAGVAFDALVMPVKVLDARGQGAYDVIAQGIIYAADRGARVINLSASGRGGSQALQEAVNYAANKGVLVVAAAGNSGAEVEYPAAYANALAVGAIGYDLARVDYSNFGPELDLAAPGGNTDVDRNGDGYPDGVLQQTFRGDVTNFGLYFYEGTSMATPHVSGVAAMLFGLSPQASSGQVRRALENTARDLGVLGRDNEYGYGLVQAANALAAIGGPPTSTPTATPSLTPTPSPTPTGPSPTPTFTLTPATPTLTPTPTATLPPTTQNLIANGDFEGAGGWIFSSTRYPAGYSTAVVHGGSRSARAGIVDGFDVFSYSSLWQPATIPPGARRATLTYWVYPISQDVYPRDMQLVLLLDPNFRIIRYLDRTLSNAQQWVSRSYDLTPYAGRTVLIYFGVVNQGYTGRTSAMYVDDVALVVER
jgi:serine protease